EMLASTSAIAEEFAAIEKAKLRRAYKCASEVYKAQRKIPSDLLKDRMVIDLAAIVLQVIDCIEGDTSVLTGTFDRFYRYVKPDAQAPLLKLGYSLAVVLDKLLTDRLTGQISPYYDTMDQAEPSTSQSFPDPIPEPIPTFTMMAPDEIKQELNDEDKIGEQGNQADDILFAEVKEEPMLELAEVKEEPLADVFCPTTGDSRTLDESRQDQMIQAYDDAEDEEDDDEDMDDEDYPPPMATATVFPAEEIDGVSTRSGKTTGTPKKKKKKTDGFAKPHTNLNPAVVKCYMCGQKTDEFYQMPVNWKRRQSFLAQSVVATTTKEKAAVDKLRKNRDNAYICLDHLPGMPRRNKTSLSQWKTQCDLCDDPQPPCIFAPKIRVDKRQFFDNLVELLPQQQERVRWFLNNPNQRANICMKHFRKVSKKVIEENMEEKKQMEKEMKNKGQAINMKFKLRDTFKKEPQINENATGGTVKTLADLIKEQSRQSSKET
ncbi:hypothetical protein PMAYCL1PPCAC_04714, partial [Pristionchus mayeri]